MNRLRAHRLDRGLTQFELADATNGAWPRWKIQMAENGHYNPSPIERAAIARALNLKPDELFGTNKNEDERSEP